jgi:hypothetical protein
MLFTNLLADYAAAWDMPGLQMSKHFAAMDISFKLPLLGYKRAIHTMCFM